MMLDCALPACLPLLPAAGTMGLKGQLCCGEIIEQLVHALRVTSIRNIVFMVSENKTTAMGMCQPARGTLMMTTWGHFPEWIMRSALVQDCGGEWLAQHSQVVAQSSTCRWYR